MRLFTLVFFLFNSAILFAQTFELCKIMDNEMKQAKFKLNHKSNPATASYDIKYNRLELEINPEVKYIKGKVVTYFTTTDSIDAILFDLTDSLRVDSVVYHSVNVSFKRTVSNTVSAILPAVLPSGSLDSIEVYYQGVPNTNGLGSFVQSSYNGDSIIWTLSQPYGAQEWWPCKNSLTDKIDSIEIIVSSPLNYKTASNGILLKIDTINQNHAFHWKSTYFIPSYLIAISVANYDSYEEQVQLGNNTLLMNHYLFKDQTLIQSNDGLLSFMNLFDSLFGTYPFIKEKYGHASFVRGGGMEHQTMSFMGDYGGELKAHEVAHQWFGNKITCDSWSNLWLNEGFATYLTVLTYEFNTAHSSIYYPIALGGIKASAMTNPNGSVYKADTAIVANLFDDMVYAKGAYLLHMLRWKIGDNAFFQGIRNYINDPELAYSFASTNDLKQHLENASGVNLEEFFKDWFYGKGFPRYSTQWSQTNETLQLSINQQPTDPSVYFFNIPLPYRLIGPNLDTTIVVEPIYNNQLISVAISQQIDSIVFDPKSWVLAESNVSVGLKESNGAELGVELYPNPVLSGNSVEFKATHRIERIEVFSSTGKKVSAQFSNSFISTIGITPGLYFVKFWNTESFELKKLLVQ